MGMSSRQTVPLFPDHYQIITNTSPDGERAPKRKRKPRKAAPKPKPPPQRLDVERICKHLADRVEAVGFKLPTITEEWRHEGRLLLDKDGKTEDQVIRCIDWATNDTFWRKNIRSMPTLRKQYERLKLDAEDERKGRTRASPRQMTEVNGMRLRPETAARLQDRARFEAMDAALAAQQTAAIEGTR